MKLPSMTLGARLGTSFLGLAMLAMALGAFALRQLSVVDEHMEAIAANSLPGVELVGRLRLATNRLRLAEAEAVLAASVEERAAIDKRIAALHASIADHETGYARLIDSDEERAAFEGYRTGRERYAAELAKSLAAAAATPGQAAARFHDASGPAFEKLAEGLTRLNEVNTRAAAEARDSARLAYATAHRGTLMFVGVALAAAVALAFLIVRSVTRQLGGEPAEAAELARRVAGGDLAVPIRLRPDDAGSMMAQLKTMQDSLAKVVGGVRGNADSVATASAQIAQGNADLSSRTEEQAAALEQTAASMEQLGSTVSQNADNAKQANQLALSASSIAQRGGEVVGEVVRTMKGINESSRRIADITGVIDGIAFQTNILALNAAVEAARAGEQGRGFAVVAGEVRTLAQRSAEAAKEIKGLIGASVDRVERGTALVDQAGSTMADIVAAVRRVADIIGEISAATVEQSAGVGQVGEAVSQMDQATQQNAALVEESAAAAESLKQQAAQLVRAVAVFTLAQEPAAAPASADSAGRGGRIGPQWARPGHMAQA